MPELRPRRYRALSTFERRRHSLHVEEWGPATAPRVALCVHTYLGNGREFDPLARALAARGWRVVCPDLPGHGLSDRREHAGDYGAKLYLHDLRRLLRLLEIERVAVVGLSLGSVLGMRLAERRGPVSRLVAIDSGPKAPGAAIARIASTMPHTSNYPDAESAARVLVHLYRDNGPISREELARVIATKMRRTPEGFRLLYDQRLADQFRMVPHVDRVSWPWWDGVACPTLIVRGERSLMLTDDQVQEMIARRPGTELVVLPGAGHRPWLRTAEQIDPIVAWLDTGEN